MYRGMLGLAFALLFAIPGVPPAQGQESASGYCHEAQELLAQRKYAEARTAARRALEIDSDSAEAESLMGTAEFALGDFEAARRHLERALSLQPDLLAARRALGATYMKQQRLSEARREFQMALDSQPKDFLSLYSLGLTYLLDDQPAEALKWFEKASQLNPTDFTLLAGLLKAYLKLREAPKAADTLSLLDARLHERDPRRLELAALLVSEGAFDLAIPEFERLLKAQPESHEIGYNLALAYHRAGKETEALALLERMVKVKEDAELENLLGEVERSRGNRAGALAAFERAAELEPENEDYRFDSALALCHQEPLTHALGAFAAGTRDFPRSVRMWLGWGATFYLAGKYADAARTLLRAAEIAPQRPEVYYLLGRAYDAAGPLQEAFEQRFVRYLSNQPSDAWAEYFYGKILATRGRQDLPGTLAEAQQHLERAIALDANLAEAYAGLGAALETRGDLEGACKALERAVELDPKSSAAYYKLAQVYRKLGRSDRARTALEKFQQLKKEAAQRERDAIRGFLERAKQ